jgi:hypothetical protein
LIAETCCGSIERSGEGTAEDGCGRFQAWVTLTREIVVVIPREEQHSSGCLPAVMFLVLVLITGALLSS